MKQNQFINCHNGGEHNWLPSGSGCFVWVATVTGIHPPPGAPFVREEVCSTCGMVRYMPAIPASQPDTTRA